MYLLIFFTLLGVSGTPGTTFSDDIVRQDTVFLDEIMVRAPGLEVVQQFQPVMMTRIDSVSLSAVSGGNIADLLRFHSPVFVRSYGTGSHTVSSRGFGGRQTQLVLNGFQVNHAMLGQADLSLFPVSQFSSVTMTSGAGSSAYGTGGVGGQIQMELHTARNFVEFSHRQGNWGLRGYEARAGYATENWWLVIGGLQQEAENNFPYFNMLRQRDEERQNNAYQQQYGLIGAGWHEGRWRINSMFWAGEKFSEVAGAATGMVSQAEQDDIFWYNISSVNYATDKGSWQLNHFSSRVQLDYRDPRSNINSESISRQSKWRLINQYAWDEFAFFSTGIEWSRTKVETNNYHGEPFQTVFSVFHHSEIKAFPEVRFFPSLRWDAHSETDNYLTGAMGINYETPINGLFLRGQGARNVTVPSMNDLYWTPGGNPDLKTEKSWSLESGLHYLQRVESLSLSASGTLYRIWFEDGIRWQPGSSGIWSPVNIEEINSRGAEILLRTAWQFRKFETSLSYTFAYTETTSPRLVNGELKELQLPYVPLTNHKVFAHAQWSFLFAGFGWEQPDVRFTTADHSSPFEPLSSYNLIMAQAGFSYSYQSLQLSGRWTVLNVGDAEYQIISGYPMPPRNHEFSLTLTYNY